MAGPFDVGITTGGAVFVGPVFVGRVGAGAPFVPDAAVVARVGAEVGMGVDIFEADVDGVDVEAAATDDEAFASEVEDATGLAPGLAVTPNSVVDETIDVGAPASPVVVVAVIAVAGGVTAGATVAVTGGVTVTAGGIGAAVRVGPVGDTSVAGTWVAGTWVAAATEVTADETPTETMAPSNVFKTWRRSTAEGSDDTDDDTDNLGSTKPSPQSSVHIQKYFVSKLIRMLTIDFRRQIYRSPKHPRTRQKWRRRATVRSRGHQSCRSFCRTVPELCS